VRLLDRNEHSAALPPAGVVGELSPRRSRSGWALSDPAVLGWLLLLALVARGTGYLPSAIDPDESLYAVQAREWLRGGWPYVAVWDIHPVGAPALFALALGLLGESIAVLRLLGTLAVIATGYLLFRTARLAREGRATGLIAGLLYVAYSAMPGGMATNTEILFAPFVTAGVALTILAARELLEAGRAPGPGRGLAIGLCFGLALWVKTVAAPEAALAFAGLAGLALARRALGPGRLVPLALAFALGCLLPTAATALAYALRGEFAAFLEANITAPLLYLGTDGPELPMALRLILAALLQLAWLLAATAAGLAEALRSRSGRTLLLPGAVLLWVCAATLGIALPGKFYTHYFMMWLPPLCLGAALGIRAMVTLAAPRLPRAALLVATAMIASMPVLSGLAGTAHRGMALRRPDPPRVVAAEIRRLLPPGETAFLVNYEPVVYLLAGLPLPTRMPFWQHLGGAFGNTMGQDSDAELARVLAGRPYLLVITEYEWGKLRPEVRDFVEATVAAGYDLASTFQDGRGQVEIWRRR
jgi:Dolichyl-phosphate-mannose-protein mannosyltransferase